MDVMIEARNLRKEFAVAGGRLHAVDNISFQLQRGKTLGVVGESGCGKSTLGKMLVGLTGVTSGEVLFQGRSIEKANRAEWKQLRKEMQMIFQDPLSSLDPRLCVRELIEEPLKIFKVCGSRSELDERVLALMEQVGISEHMMYAYPHELDGGRRQRVGIARALVLEPELIVYDEATSALDVSVQKTIVELLVKLQKEKDIAYGFICHDMALVQSLSHQVAVMYLGSIMEVLPGAKVASGCLHPYTKAMIDAVFDLRMDFDKPIKSIESEAPSPLDLPAGCPFQNRCPRCMEICRREKPALRQIEENHQIACHLYGQQGEQR